MRLEGKKVLVTGGSRGIGREICLLAAREGADVALAYLHSADGAQEVARQIEAMGRRAFVAQADFSDSAQTQHFIDEGAQALGALDALIYCAGVFPQALIEEISDEDWRRVMSVNVDGAFYACRAAVPHLRARRGGRIVLFSSQAALAGTAHGVHYGASKAALLGMTYCLAKELGPDQITVNAVLPGRIDTDMLQYADEARRQQWLQATPLGYFGTPTDAAEIAVFLASDAARYITGAKININGGLLPG